LAATETAPTLPDIEAARALLDGVARVTPVYRSETLSRLAGREVQLKAENLQRTGSFKVRGAYNRISALTAEQRAAGVVAASAGNHGQAVAWAALEVGSHAVANQKVLVFDFQNSHSVDLHLFRGVLGEDFLGEFDMLIDNAHNLLCLDDSSAMAADVKGPHIALMAPARTTDGMPALRSLIIAARLSDGTRPVRLKLDSGTNVSFLFYTARYMPLELLASTSLLGGGSDRAQRPVSTMPLQDLQIGSLELPRVSFFTYADSPKGLSRTSAYDGLLTLGIFRRVFICHAHHFAVFEPW